MKVSVCVPIYGVEKYIERCARSLFEQTMKDDIEFIFVNDCTPDRSEQILLAVLEDYPQRKNQVKILHHAENQGLTGARSTALNAACGDYIIHCDSDDWVDPALYETMYRTAVERQADVVCCAITLENSTKSSRRIQLAGKSVDDLFFDFFNTVAFNSLCNKMFSGKIARDAETIIPKHMIMAEDLLLTTQMLLKCRNIALCNDVSYHYFRGNSASATANFSLSSFESQRKVINILLKVLPGKYDSIAEACKGQLLFSALRISEITGEDFYGLYPSKVLHRVLFNRHLAFCKRTILSLSVISFSLARFCCRVLIFLAQKMHMK